MEQWIGHADRSLFFRPVLTLGFWLRAPPLLARMIGRGIVGLTHLMGCAIIEVNHSTELPPTLSTNPTLQDPCNAHFCSQHLGRGRCLPPIPVACVPTSRPVGAAREGVGAMTWLDFLTIGFCLVILVIEVKRGAVCAIIDTAGCWIALKTAAFTYQGFVTPTFSYTASYITVFLVIVAIAAVISTIVKMRTETDLGPFDSAIAAALGVLTGLFFGHVAFGAAFLQSGPEYKAFAEAAMRAQVYELKGLNGFLDFMGRIGGTEVAD